MPNLVSFAHPSPQILDKFQAGPFPIPEIPIKTLINKNCQNLRSNSEIDMKLGPLGKIVKRNTTTSTKIRHDNDIL